MSDLVFIKQDSVALPKLIVVSVLIGGGSNPTGVTASLLFEFQERVDVLYKQSALPRSCIVPSESAFVHFVNLQDSLTLRDGHSYFVQDPRATDRPFGVEEMPTWSSHVLFGGALSSQAEQEILVTPQRQHGMIQVHRRNDREFYQSFHL